MADMHFEPPQSLEAETHLLGGLLQDNEKVPDCLAILRQEDFYWEKHQLIFQAIIKLDRERSPIDVVTLSEALSADENLQRVGGREYLFNLMENVASAANVVWHGQIIKQKSLLRGLISSSNQIIRESLDPSANPLEVIGRAEAQIFEISQHQVRDSLRPVGEVLQDVLKMIEKYRKDEVSGVPSGFADLDKLTNGLQKTDFIVLAGRPAMGKTAFALTLAANAAIRHKKKVAFFSLEMGAEQLVQRVLCSQAEIDMSLLRTGRLPRADYQKIALFAEPIMSSHLFIDDQANLSMSELRSKCRNLARRQGLDLVVVDYLQLMETGKEENRAVAIGAISRGLKIMAKELQIPVLSLAQLSRKAEDPSRKGRPMLSDLRESGSIEQDADMVWFVHRPSVYNPQDERGKNYAELLVLKHRNGPCDDIKLTFLGNFATFRDYVPDQNADGGGFGDFEN
jgi:replicative DNA helicase